MFLEKQLGMIIFKIGDSEVFFLNDFEKKTLNWFNKEYEDVDSYYLTEIYRNNENLTQLFEFGDKGFSIQNFSLNNYLSIKQENLKKI